MKTTITPTLLLSVLLFASSLPAMAVDGGVWQEPAVSEFAELTEGEVYYFYLPDCHLFFTQGNAYGYQASAGIYGLKVRAERRGDGAWTLTDYVKTQSAWKMWWFVNNENIMFVDYNNQPDYLWEIRSIGDLAYRLSPSSLNPNCKDNTKYVGLDRTSNPDNTALYYDLTAESGAYIDWKLVPKTAYEVYEKARMTYDAAMLLKDLLDKAESIGADVAAQTAVYNDTSSTLDEIQKAIEETEAAITAREQEIAWERYATAGNPADVTLLFVTNPSFADNKYDGWQGTGFGGYNPKENAERYNMNYDTFQQIEGLKEGVYRLSVNAFYRAGNAQPAYDNYKAQNEASGYAKLYAATAEDSLTCSIVSPFSAGLTESTGKGTWRSATDAETGERFVIPNDMEAADEFFKAGFCNGNDVLAYVGGDGSLRIGVRKDVTISGDWSMFDDFSLTYYGDGDDAYVLLMESVGNNAKEYDPTADVLTWSYLSAYNEALAGLGKAADKESSIGAMREFRGARDSLERNIQLWKELADTRQEATVIYSFHDMEDDELAVQLLEWLDTTYGTLVEERTLSNGQLEEEIATIRQWTEVVISRHLERMGIDDMHSITEKKGVRLYDLQGRRLASPPEKGVYIQDGKKYVK